MEQAIVQLPLGRPHQIISHALTPNAEIKEVQLLGEQAIRKFSDERTGAAGLIVKIPFERAIDLAQASQDPEVFEKRSFIVLPANHPVDERFQYLGSYQYGGTLFGVWECRS